MKHPKGIWLRRGLLPYYLTGHRLALALLLRDKPSTAAQRRSPKRAIAPTRRRSKNRWPA